MIQIEIIKIIKYNKCKLYTFSLENQTKSANE